MLCLLDPPQTYFTPLAARSVGSGLNRQGDENNFDPQDGQIRLSATHIGMFRHLLPLVRFIQQQS
jgi:hypothetical protein